MEIVVPRRSLPGLSFITLNIFFALFSHCLFGLSHAVSFVKSEHNVHNPSPLAIFTGLPTSPLNTRDTTVSNTTGQTGGSSASSSSTDFTCGPDKECVNGACCGESGWCGYGPTYCGDGCQSNCNATAECGQYATVAGQTCPLNVCCSEFGFCGTTTDFCDGGCQSNCEQPKPSTGGGNVQQRVIGYWEAWNLDHPCGTMNPSEIPVSMLTHLNVAFGYITSDFKITNMDGVSTTMYKNAAAVKSKNPNLKVLIALGGWSFSDPGNWQSVFPTMASTASNRATFINNLLGWLSEYGYDGVDFDWEYPGADDRGGSEGDGENFTALLKELRTAINASGKEYIVTFTAPSSYWYLRHFDITNMVGNVDWINLMSYDLHGVWDSNNPIGNQVIAHTNLTEIDLALDLFWRNNIEPSKIVLGLGFYGRSFELSSPSCWRPGCEFSGPGAEGVCTKTAGILSYREISGIIDQTGGGKPYFDEVAAVKYMVYNGNSWISYDDADTFKLKIAYANTIGLGGLMIWAIDQDDTRLTALRAVTDSSLASDDTAPFTLVDLHRLWSIEDYPTDDSNPRYGLVNFGGEANMGETNPDKTGFGFFIVAGDSYAVSRLRSRDGEPEPFTFLDCPSNVMSRPDNHVQYARVVCLSENIEGCFRVMEQGVEGTIIEMPDNCAPGTFARAIALNTSDDQSLPSHLQARATSEVFDFSFDFNFELIRKDTDQTSIRLDYSSLPGYWNDIVDSEGIESSDVKRLTERFFSRDTIYWTEKFGSLSLDESRELNVEQSLTQSLYWDSINECSVDGSEFGEGIGAYIDGNIKARFEYGFSLGAVIQDGKLLVQTTNGVLYAEGYSDLTYTVGGVGRIDVAQAKNGNPSWYAGEKTPITAHTVYASGMKGWASYKPYVQVDYMMATMNADSFSDSEITLNGLLGARVNTSLGPIVGVFPAISSSGTPSGVDIADPRISIPQSNVIYGSGPGLDTAKIALACYFSFGLDVDFGVQQNGRDLDWEGPDIKLRFESSAEFTNDASSGSGTCVDYRIATVERVWIEDPGALASLPQWPDSTEAHVVYSSVIEPEGEGLCYADAKRKRSLPEAEEIRLKDESTEQSAVEQYNSTQFSQLNSSELFPITRGLEKRISSMPGFGYVAGVPVTPGLIFKGADFSRGPNILDKYSEKINCRNCLSCESVGEDREIGPPCCGCVSMDLVWEYNDKPACDTCNPDDGTWPGTIILASRSDERGDDVHANSTSSNKHGQEYHLLNARVSGTATLSPKALNVCGSRLNTRGNNRYPSFPANVNWPWDGIEQGRWDGISKYWGNDSATCSDWGVTALNTADTTYVSSSTAVRSKYQTEHVFEAQLIGDFFSNWLDQGQIKNQQPDPDDPSQKFSCKQTKQHILNGQNWMGGTQPFIRYIMEELGSIDNLDRLTIYLARPNRAKGAMFTGNQPTSPVSYGQMTSEEQLLAVKEMGMMFSYLNDATVWPKFCATYEGIYDKMGEFDEWYNLNVGPASFNIQEEWKDYIRVALDSLVLRSRDSLSYYIANKRFTVNLTYLLQWGRIQLFGRSNIKLDQVCKHMDATTV